MDLAGRTLEERRARLCEPRHTLSKEKAWADRIFRQWTNLRCARLWLGFAGASWLLWLGSEFVCLMAVGGGRARSGWENDMTDATNPRPERPLLDHYRSLFWPARERQRRAHGIHRRRHDLSHYGLHRVRQPADP